MPTVNIACYLNNDEYLKYMSDKENINDKSRKVVKEMVSKLKWINPNIYWKNVKRETAKQLKIVRNVQPTLNMLRHLRLI